MKPTKYGDYEKVVVFHAWAGYQVHVVFSGDLARSRRGRYGSTGIAEEPKTAAFHTSTEDGHSHIFFKPDASAGVIAHESWHAIYRMFDWAGVIRFDNEATAYHLGHLVGAVSDFQRKVLGVKSNVARGKDAIEDSAARGTV